MHKTKRAIKKKKNSATPNRKVSELKGFLPKPKRSRSIAEMENAIRQRKR